MQGLLKKNEKKKIVRYFSFPLRHNDNILSVNNVNLRDYVDRIYLIKLEIKDISDTASSASCVHLHI